MPLQVSSSRKHPIVANTVDGSKLNFDEIYRLCQKRKYGKLSELLLRTYSFGNPCSIRNVSEAANHKEFNSKHSITTGTCATDDLSDDAIHSALERSAARSSTWLHAILIHQPTFEVVDLLCQILNHERNGTNGTSSHGFSFSRNLVVEEISDISGCKPLHVAVQNGCESNVVSRLMQRTNIRVNICLALDNNGRTPLHWAAASKSATATQKKGRLFRFSCTNHSDTAVDADNTYKVVQMLLKECPRAAMIKDNEGNRPIDLARLYQAEPRIIMALLDTEATMNKISQVTRKEKNPTVKEPTSRREVLGQQLDFLQQQFCPVVEKVVAATNEEISSSIMSPTKNFLDVVVECSSKEDFDDHISIITSDAHSQRHVFVSEELDI
jgi:ankyrin repeat protein